MEGYVVTFQGPTDKIESFKTSAESEEARKKEEEKKKMEIKDLRQQFDLLGLQQSKIKSQMAKLQEEKIKSKALQKKILEDAELWQEKSSKIEQQTAANEQRLMQQKTLHDHVHYYYLVTCNSTPVSCRFVSSFVFRKPDRLGRGWSTLISSRLIDTATQHRRTWNLWRAAHKVHLRFEAATCQQFSRSNCTRHTSLAALSKVTTVTSKPLCTT